MAQIETWVNADLTKPVQVQALQGNLFSQDVQANKIGVRVYNNGEAAALSGTISGNVIRRLCTTFPVINRNNRHNKGYRL